MRCEAHITRRGERVPLLVDVSVTSGSCVIHALNGQAPFDPTLVGAAIAGAGIPPYAVIVSAEEHTAVMSHAAMRVPQTEVSTAPHDFTPYGGIDRVTGRRCKHCYLPAHEHPTGWTRSRPLGDGRWSPP